MQCIFTVDVEDWFHILDLPSSPRRQEWDTLPSSVEKNFRKLLAIFEIQKVHVTCFFLGWIAEKFPHLVREAHDRGHEIASHGYAHQLVYEMTAQDFLQDALRSRKLLEDTIGKEVLGYRSAGFSMTKETPWFFEKLMEAGYQYDSSVFPASRGHGGIKTDTFAPYRIASGSRQLIEFPISVAKVFGKPFCFFGGGYLRLFPYFLIKAMTVRVLKENRPVVFYVHPREVDPKQPRLPMGFLRQLKSYNNLHTTEKKIERLLAEFPVTTFATFMAHHAIT